MLLGDLWELGRAELNDLSTPVVDHGQRVVLRLFPNNGQCLLVGCFDFLEHLIQLEYRLIVRGGSFSLAQEHQT